jgi:hypothetical protein
MKILSGRRAGHAAILLATAALSPTWAWAQASAESALSASDSIAVLRAELDRMRAEYEQRVAALEAKLAALEAERAAEIPAPPEPEAPPAPPAAPAPVGTGGAPSQTYFNPSVSVIGNFIGTAGDNDVEPSANLELSEVEVALQAVVDPYARADFFVAFGEEGAEIEEGFATFTALPARLLAKVGRMRAQFGKINELHFHSLTWADAPLPITNLLGGEEGWVGDGISVSRLLPLGNTFSELTVQAFRGESEGLFEATSRSDLAYNGHFKIFGDLSEASNLEVGLSYATGPNGTSDDAWTDLAALDWTYRWKPLRSATYRGVLLRGELFRSAREQPESDAESIGWYLSADARLARRWWLGGRLEAAERADDDAARDEGAALVLTFDPSEFSRLRAELRRRRYAENVTADELLMQLQFLIGAHGAHPF